MVNKYARKLENREINPETDEVWAIQDVPTIWNKKTRAKVIADGYIFEADGTAVPALGEEE